MKNKSTYIFLLAIAALTAPRGAAGTMRVESAVSFEREPVSLSKVVNQSDVLLIGDDHTQLAIKTFLTDRLKDLHLLGFRCLAVEMIPVRLQPELDRWNESDQKTIREHLNQFWGEKGWGIPESYFRLISAAKREGYMVAALDPDMAQSMDRQSVNPSWVECIQRCLIGKQGNRIIVFGGLSHFQSQTGSVVSLLKTHGMHISVLEFAGLESRESLALDLKTAELLGKSVPFRLRVAEKSSRLDYFGPFMVRDITGGQRDLPLCWIIGLRPEAPQIVFAHGSL